MNQSMIVTGAGQGIGAEIARQAAGHGYRVGVLDIDADAAEQTARSLPNAVPLVSATNHNDSVEEAFGAFGTPDALVNNAGIVRFGPLLDQSEADWRNVVDVNLTGTFLCARVFARRLIAESRSGSIVNVASINGMVPGPNAGAYGPTKAAVRLLTQQMAIEWGAEGIRVNSVAPGLIDGGMSIPVMADPDVRAARTARVPSSRLGTEADIAQAVLWLLSPDSEYVNGHQLVVDGAVVSSLLAHMPRSASLDQSDRDT